MRVYVASSYSRKAEMMEVHRLLKEARHEPTSRWVDGGEVGLSDPEKACMDMDDVWRAEALLCFTQPRGVQPNGGGHHTELGMALGWGRRVFIVGEANQVFHHHPCITQVASLGAWLHLHPASEPVVMLPLPTLAQYRASLVVPTVGDEGGGP